VDDEPQVRAMLEDLLGAMGYETRGAADGPSGVRAVLDWAPDVVLLDIGMPGLSGVGALQAIAALGPVTKVIMVSGTTDLEVSRRALAYGAFDYVTKPVDFEYLGRSVETALMMKRLEEGR
jgi:DNA-binding NtrC family response regulator